MPWLPISSAPVQSMGEEIPDCLVYSPEIGGIRMGRAWRYSDDAGAYANAYGYHGDWQITHWMPLPPPPEAES